MHKNLIICLCIGPMYGDEYVHKLANMIARNTTHKYDFKCYSDRDIPGVDVVRIEDPERYEPLFYKLQLLGLSDISTYKRKVFFDLDVVIHNNIDWVFEVEDSGLHVIDARWKTLQESRGSINTGCNSSIMIWQEAAQIFDKFQQSPDAYMMKYRGIDRFLWNEIPHLKFIPDGHAYSYREGASTKDRFPFIMRSDMSVCIYNARPKPHECLSAEPAKSHWN